MKKPPPYSSDVPVALARTTGQSPVVLPADSAKRLDEALRASKSANTARAYRKDWESFERWAKMAGLTPLPADPFTVASYLVDQAASHAVATATRRLAAIAYAHKLAGYEKIPTKTDVVREALKGIRRQYGVRPERKYAADAAVVKKMLATLHGPGLSPVRDRALLLLGYAGAFRRSTLCALQLSDLAFHDDRMDVLVRRSKTDQVGAGSVVPILRAAGEFCPVAAVTKWIASAEIEGGPVFRGLTRSGHARRGELTAQVVAQVVKACCAAAGLDPKFFSGHSLRAGHVTEATRRGARIDEIMRITGHKSADMLLRYMREADPVKGTSAGNIGLDEEDR